MTGLIACRISSAAGGLIVVQQLGQHDDAVRSP